MFIECPLHPRHSVGLYGEYNKAQQRFLPSNILQFNWGRRHETTYEKINNRV